MMENPRPAPLILYLGDHADTRKAVCTLLRARGYDVVEAANAESARELASSRKIDLFIAGIGLVNQTRIVSLRELCSRCGCPAIALTTDSRPESRDAVLAAGFQRFLLKPLGFNNLNKIIDEVLSGKNKG